MFPIPKKSQEFQIPLLRREDQNPNSVCPTLLSLTASAMKEWVCPCADMLMNKNLSLLIQIQGKKNQGQSEPTQEQHRSAC